MKFCKFCGEKILEDAVMCTHCGRQVEQLKGEQSQVIINNSNANSNINNNNNINNNSSAAYRKPKNKWISLILCLLLGFLGVHKFYEEKAGLGFIYLFTGGLFGIGIIVDFITILFKPSTYYV